MLADPYVACATFGRTSAQLVTDRATAQNFVRTGTGPTSATYRYTISSSHYIDMFVGRQVGKRSRYTVRFTESELVADPMNSELNSVKTSTAYVVVDRSVLGAGSNETLMLNALAFLLYKPSDSTCVFDRVSAGEV